MRIESWFLNLGPQSKVTIAEANSDIRAILETEPDLLTGCESVGRGALPKHSDYEKVRAHEPLGRANIFAYVKGGIAEPVWVDCKVEFPRESGDGMHWARSLLKFPYFGAQIVVGHHPPNWLGAGPARAEHLNKIRKTMAPWTTDDWDKFDAAERKAAISRSRVLLWDRNMKPIPTQNFAWSMDFWVVGHKIDSALVRNVEVLHKGYARRINGHTLHTDHPWGAFNLNFKIDG